MPKVTNNYESSKIEVDFYFPKQGGDFICSCYTPGADCKIEPEYLVKVVTYKDFKSHVAGPDGLVDTGFIPGDGPFVTFDSYLNR